MKYIFLQPNKNIVNIILIMEDIIITLMENYKNVNDKQNNVKKKKKNNKLCYREFKNINKECFNSTTDKYIEYNCDIYMNLYNNCMIKNECN